MAFKVAGSMAFQDACSRAASPCCSSQSWTSGGDAGGVHGRRHRRRTRRVRGASDMDARQRAGVTCKVPLSGVRLRPGPAFGDQGAGATACCPVRELRTGAKNVSREVVAKAAG
ncbi:MAG: hypothetical protein R2991_05475 [Thermoanaerobaculia bacterium]